MTNELKNALLTRLPISPVNNTFMLGGVEHALEITATKVEEVTNDHDGRTRLLVHVTECNPDIRRNAWHSYTDYMSGRTPRVKTALKMRREMKESGGMGKILAVLVWVDPAKKVSAEHCYISAEDLR